MKKKLIYSLVLLTGLFLVACGGSGKTEKQTDSTKESAKSSQTKDSTSESKTKSSATSSSIKASSSSETKTSQSQTAVKSENNSPANQAEMVLNELNAAFPNDRLPQAILTSQTAEYLSAATTRTADQENFRILYYAENGPISVNDNAVNNLQPIASFEKKTYSSNEAAANAVGQIIDNGGSKIDLGYGITGYQQGAAGSSYLSWQEGNWSLVVRASNIEGEKAEPLAKEVVAYLEQAMLPAPKNVGQITLTTTPSNSYQNNSVLWQKGSAVYTIQHFDALQAVKMTVSTNR
ncbi:hypothetical protein [Candidatus Enterococcus mansonii]|uniref:Lipoprotein n=1 Tax=Candidatus Enterococcus mansonii TaxID=1834181 RepID=A0A242CDE1_9ENTE|nr:hypothetical protein [Enterococcus sp. 4G2_DIV0659]OTO08284.1 hypothetical protein A5880_002555 [Enterococcus sp. 4G2_DIV0659]